MQNIGKKKKLRRSLMCLGSKTHSLETPKSLHAQVLDNPAEPKSLLTAQGSDQYVGLYLPSAQTPPHASQATRKDSRQGSTIHVNAWAPELAQVPDSAQAELPAICDGIQEEVDRLVRSDYDFLQETIEETDPGWGLVLYQHYYRKHALTFAMSKNRSPDTAR